jgi:hypothetical protein
MKNFYFEAHYHSGSYIASITIEQGNFILEDYVGSNDIEVSGDDTGIFKIEFGSINRGTEEISIVNTLEDALVAYEIMEDHYCTDMHPTIKSNL